MGCSRRHPGSSGRTAALALYARWAFCTQDGFVAVTTQRRSALIQWLSLSQVSQRPARATLLGKSFWGPGGGKNHSPNGDRLKVSVLPTFNDAEDASIWKGKLLKNQKHVVPVLQ